MKNLIALTLSLLFAFNLFAGNNGFGPFQPAFSIYVDNNGNDGNNGLTPSNPLQNLTTAVANALPYATNGAQITINLGYGYFNVSNTLIDLQNIVISGKHRMAPQNPYANLSITATFYDTTNATVIGVDGNSGICLGDNSGLNNLTLWQTMQGHHPIACLGGGGINNKDGDPTWWNYLNQTSTNDVIDDCDLYGILQHNVCWNTTNKITLTMRNDDCFVYESTPCIEIGNQANVSPSVNNGLFTNYLWLQNCNFYCGVVLGVGHGALTLSQNDTVVYSQGCTFQRYQANGNNNCVAVEGTNSVLYLMSSTLAGDVPKLFFANSATNDTVYSFNNSVNPSLLQNTGFNCAVIYDISGYTGTFNAASLASTTAYVTNGIVITIH